MRHTFLRVVALGGTSLVTVTELLSIFEHLRRTTVLIAWAIIAVCGTVVVIHRRPRFQIKRPCLDPIVVLCVGACVVILAITATVAILSPPNSTDAMAYHMPRVVYWAEQSSVRFFPTPYLPQIMLQPFAEYAMLHLYLLTGGDYGINLIQWFAFATSIVAVSVAAGLFGSCPRGQALAALFCATLPSAILASSGAKNDCVLGMWMLIAVCFAIRLASTSRIIDAFYLGSAIGLALLTKGTAYLFLPFVVAAILIQRWRTGARRGSIAATIALGCALAINIPQFVRNHGLSGSILGFDSAQGDGLFRWRNETHGWKQTASNVVRHVTEQLGGRSERWNHGVYSLAVSIHRTLNIDPNDPATTWRGEKFEPPKNANHEANAPNRWHLAILVVIAAMLAWRLLHGRDRKRSVYLAALLCSFVAFCAYLKWQPFMARLVLPLLLAAAPMAAILTEVRPSAIGLLVQVSLCLFVLDNARLPLLQNWVRPLKGPASILHTDRRERYFADMVVWNNRDSYVRSADIIARTGCEIVGIDINNNQLEYPLIALVREANPSARFVHTGVANASQRYRQPVEGSPCAVVCLDCGDDIARLRRYGQFPQSAAAGKFIVLY